MTRPAPSHRRRPAPPPGRSCPAAPSAASSEASCEESSSPPPPGTSRRDAARPDRAASDPGPDRAARPASGPAAGPASAGSAPSLGKAAAGLPGTGPARPSSADAPPSLPEAQALSAEDRAALERLIAPLRAGRPANLMLAMHVKRLLGARLPPAEALAACRALFGLDAAVGLRRRPMRGLLEALQSSGGLRAVFHEGAAGGAACDPLPADAPAGDPLPADAPGPQKPMQPAGPLLRCRPPRVLGPGAIPPLEGRPRSVFAGALHDATVFARSAAILHQGCLLFDIQPGELAAAPAELAFDPLVLRREGDRLLAFDDTHPGREMVLDHAWSLMGINSIHFGHWSVEQLAQFLTARALPGFAEAPVLIDAGMPRQHRQSLEAFAPPGMRLIEVAPGTRVRVGRLQVMSNWLYCPHHIVTDHAGWDPSVFVGAFDGMAAVYRAAGAELARRHGSAAPAAAPAGGLFWARDTRRHRAIANHEAVAALLARHGYAAHRPETLDFTDQILRLRGAARVVVQNGSALHALLLGRPGTRICYLSHPFLPLFALIHEMLAQLGHEVTVLTGPMAARHAAHAERSGYEIPLDRLEAFLETWPPSDTPSDPAGDPAAGAAPDGGDGSTEGNAGGNSRGGRR